MRSNCNIEEVGERLENAVMSLPNVSEKPKELYSPRLIHRITNKSRRRALYCRSSLVKTMHFSARL